MNTTTIIDQWTGRVRTVKASHPEARRNGMIEELTYRIALKPCPLCHGRGVVHVPSVTPDVPGVAMWGEHTVCWECAGEGNAAGELEEERRQCA